MKPLIDGVAIDRECAEETDCPKCGKKMTFRPEFFDEYGERTYRAFAECKPCGISDEF